MPETDNPLTADRIASGVGIVLLAAGPSQRMKTPKQVLQFRGRSLLGTALEAAAGTDADCILVVLGSGAAGVSREIVSAAVRTIDNPGWREGLASSLRAGVAALPPALRAVLFMVCDQPLVTGAHLNRLISAYRTTGAPVVASAYSGTLGVPALFDRALFPEILALRGDVGAKQVILRHRAEATVIPFSAGAVDIDSPSDYRRWSRK